ncbi:MAG TPA: hypothetical protein VK306_08800 [Acidimicrobiales bacterium]|nr:hypothetical protein [Acidimicrobiales bacterium]
MSIVWAVPVIAAAVAAGLVAAHARRLEDAATALTREVGRLSELRWSLAALRSAAQETDARVAGFRARHAVSPVEDADDGAATVERSGADDTDDAPPAAVRPLRVIEAPDRDGLRGA